LGDQVDVAPPQALELAPADAGQVQEHQHELRELVVERPHERLHFLRPERVPLPLRRPRARDAVGDVAVDAFGDDRPREDRVEDAEVARDSRAAHVTVRPQLRDLVRRHVGGSDLFA
jgi:hypothetical protein